MADIVKLEPVEVGEEFRFDPDELLVTRSQVSRIKNGHRWAEDA